MEGKVARRPTGSTALNAKVEANDILTRSHRCHGYCGRSSRRELFIPRCSGRQSMQAGMDFQTPFVLHGPHGKRHRRIGTAKETS